MNLCEPMKISQLYLLDHVDNGADQQKYKKDQNKRNASDEWQIRFNEANGTVIAGEAANWHCQRLLATSQRPQRRLGVRFVKLKHLTIRIMW